MNDAHATQESAPTQPSGPPSPSAEISRGMVSLIRDYAGRGPTAARTTIGRDTVTVILSDTLTKGERTLVEHGEAGHVLRTRHKVQLMMRDKAVALVESALERKVIAFMSDNHIDPDVAAEIFVLDGQGDAQQSES